MLDWYMTLIKKLKKEQKLKTTKQEIIALSNGIELYLDDKMVVNNKCLPEEDVLHIVLRAKAKLSGVKKVCHIVNGKATLADGWEMLEC